MPASTTVTIPVGGMHCQNCANSIQKSLSGMPGVTGVQVNLDKGLTVVTGADLDIGGIRGAIEDLGFDAGHPV
jgi:copper chaperone